LIESRKLGRNVHAVMFRTTDMGTFYPTLRMLIQNTSIKMEEVEADDDWNPDWLLPLTTGENGSLILIVYI
jgi:hypothetical protein